YNIFYNKIVIPEIKKRSKKDSILVIAMDFSTEERLKKAGIEFKRLSEYRLEKIEREAGQKSMDFAGSIPEKNPLLKEAVNYRGISLWDSDIIDIWESFFLGIVTNIDSLKAIIKNEKPKKILLFDSSSEFGMLAKGVALKEKIPLIDKTPLIARIKSGIIRFGGRIAIKKLGEYSCEVRRLRRIRSKRWDSSEEKAGKVVIFTNSPRTLKLTLPWAKMMKKCPVEVIGLSDSDKGMYDRENISYLPFSKFVDAKLNDKVNKEEKRLSSLWHVRRKEFISVEYDGIDISRSIIGLFEFLFLSRFTELIFYIEVSERAIKERKPSLIVLFDCWNYFSKTVISAARKNGIKTLFVQHGVISDIPLFSKTNVDAMAIYGEETRDILVRHGNSQNKIHITGSLQLDYLKARRRNSYAALEKIGINRKKKVIVFFSQPLPENEMIPAFHSLFEAAKSMPEVQLVIKLHPAESPALAERIMHETGSNAIIVKNVGLAEILGISSAAITISSTTFLDALASDKPLIVLNLAGEDTLPCVNDGAAIGVYKKENILPSIRKILYDKKTIKNLSLKRKSAVKKYAYRIDGMASKRIAELAENLALKR
ncbi:MAG: UDP-N-acetylglucosamine 2-epimerase, partial [Candidatus Woesearchaeota archaeon]|nr:UDP-N-acetylglucosamine 2-epimerase [Candidatus Woesearchaeota archaeon]